MSVVCTCQVTFGVTFYAGISNWEGSFKVLGEKSFLCVDSVLTASFITR